MITRLPAKRILGTWCAAVGAAPIASSRKFWALGTGAGKITTGKFRPRGKPMRTVVPPARLGLMALVRARARARRMRIGSDDCSASAVRGLPQPRPQPRQLPAQNDLGRRTALFARRLLTDGTDYA